MYQGRAASPITFISAVPGDLELELQLVRDLVKANWTREHIIAVTGWSQATFYRRLSVVQEREPDVECPTLRDVMNR
jgi:hypothetical protein